MGPNNSKPKQEGRLSEQEILKEAQQFLQENNICKPEDEHYQTLQIVVAKITLYGNRHLLDHVRRCQTKDMKIKYLEKWKTLPFQQLDHVFQNLIKLKMTKVDDEQNFTKIKPHQKYDVKDRQQFLRICQRGEDIIRKKKVAVIIFAGSSSTKSEEYFDKEFYRQHPTDKCLFQIIMGRLEQIGNKYGFPSTYLFYNGKQADQVTGFLKKYKYGDKVQTCMQSTQPILNLNGNFCLRSKDSPDIIEMPTGSGDFYNMSIKGMGILNKMKMDGVDFASCCDCQNMIETILDPYVVGLMNENKAQYDLMYKVTYPQNQKDRIFRRVVLQNGGVKADTIQDLTSLVTYNNKQRTINMENLRESPVWMNSVVFKVQSILDVIGSADNRSIFPQAVNYKTKIMSYWSPVDVQMRSQESCYVFEKELSDLLMNNLFKSKAIMVDRDEEYLPVITEKNQFNWRDAYKEYRRKQDKHLLIPLQERLKSPQMMQSLIRSDQYDHKTPN